MNLLVRREQLGVLKLSVHLALDGILALNDHPVAVLFLSIKSRSGSTEAKWTEERTFITSRSARFRSCSSLVAFYKRK